MFWVGSEELLNIAHIRHIQDKYIAAMSKKAYDQTKQVPMVTEAESLDCTLRDGHLGYVKKWPMMTSQNQRKNGYKIPVSEKTKKRHICVNC